jgi:hypothetical protein
MWGVKDSDRVREKPDAVSALRPCADPGGLVAGRIRIPALASFRARGGMAGVRVSALCGPDPSGRSAHAPVHPAVAILGGRTPSTAGDSLRSVGVVVSAQALSSSRASACAGGEPAGPASEEVFVGLSGFGTGGAEALSAHGRLGAGRGAVCADRSRADPGYVCRYALSGDRVSAHLTPGL